jgi:hypothetical protein
VYVASNMGTSDRIDTSAWGIAPRGSIVAREGGELSDIVSRGPKPLSRSYPPYLLREAHTRPSHGERWGVSGLLPKSRPGQVGEELRSKERADGRGAARDGAMCACGRAPGPRGDELYA